MKTAPILRQMPVAPSSRLLGKMSQLPPREPGNLSAAVAAKAPAPSAASPTPLAPAGSVMSEAEIEQRGLAIAQRMMRAEADQLRRAAREEGFQAGRAEGLRAAQDEVKKQLVAQQTQFLSVFDALESALSRDRAATEDAALELTMASLARILGQTPDVESVVAVVRQASARLRESTQVRVRMAPADIELLKAAGVLPVALVPQASDVQWIADAAVEGGCVLQTATGDLDARLHKQVASLAEALTRTYRARGVQP